MCFIKRKMCPRKVYFTHVLLAFSVSTFAVAAPVTGKANEAAVAIVPSAAGGVVQMAISLAVVLLVIFGGAWLLRRVGNYNGRATAGLKVLGGVSVGSRERIVLIQVGGQQLLVGIAPGHIQTLHVLSHPLDSGEAVVRPLSTFDLNGFAARLAAAVKQNKPPS